MLREVTTIVAVAVVACAPPTPPVAVRPLVGAGDAAEYARFRVPGRLILSGQAFLTTRGGDVKVAAGRTVTLDPATTYAKEWFRRLGAGATNFDSPPPDSLFVLTRRSTTADAQGRFRFASLVPGDYLVRTTVTWETGAAYSGLQGGVVASFVSVRDSGVTEVILNQVITQVEALAAGIVVLNGGRQASRPVQSLGPVQGTSCRASESGPEPTESAAIADLALAAARLDADAVRVSSCRQVGPVLLVSCFARVVCDGEALRWN